jgi:transcriptional regulator with XRE-family HTH domain
MSQMVETDQVPEWTLGWRLQRALAHAGVSVEEMADELGVTRQTIGRWLHERGEPKRGYLKLWALRTGVPLAWLMGAGSGNLRS